VERLAASAVEPNPFFEPWMLFPAIELLEEARRAFCILIFRKEPGGAERLCGFFPVTEQSRYHGFRARTISLLQHKYGYMSAPLLDREHGAEALEFFFGWCRFTERAGLIEFPALAVDGAFHQLLIGVLNRKSLWSRPEQRYTRAIYKPALTAEAYLTLLSGKARKHLRRQMQLLRESGCVDYSILEPAADPTTWVEEFLEMEASGWKGRQGTALASTEADRTYFKRIAAEGMDQGRMLGAALRLEGRMIAARTVLTSSGASYVFKIAYSEEYAAYSPGALLEVEAIKHGLPEKICWTDSSTVGGSNLYDRLWKDLRTMEHVLVATGTSAGELIFAAVPVARWIKRRLRHLQLKGKSPAAG
jgi:hypothetical protein